MHISLLPDLEELIERKVASGEYASPSDVIIHALYLFDQHDKLRQIRLEELRREIDIGIQECERGETEPFTKETVKAIEARGRQRLLESAARLEAEAKAMAERARQPVDEAAQAD